MPRVAKAAWQKKSALLLDLAIDLLVPPISYPALVVVFGCALEAGHWLLTGSLSVAAPVWLFCSVALTAYVVRGVVFSGTGLAGVRALATAPAYILWKLVIAKPWNNTSQWVRTSRET